MTDTKGTSWQTRLTTTVTRGGNHLDAIRVAPGRGLSRGGRRWEVSRGIRYPITIAVALVLVLLSTVVASAQTPPGPVVRYTTRFVGVTPPASQFEIVEQVLEYARGAGSAFHSHGGPVFVTVIEGEMTYRELGKQGVVVKAGETYRELLGQVIDASNAGPERARVVAAFLLPAGATLTTPHAGVIPATVGAKVLGLTRNQVTAPAATFDVVQIIQDFAPGAAAPVHKHGGPGQITVFEGTLTQREGAKQTVYAAGSGWLEPPDQLGSPANLGSVPASLAATFLHQAGVPLTTIVGAPGAPNTGTGAVAERTQWELPVGGLLIIITLLGTAMTITARARR